MSDLNRYEPDATAVSLYGAACKCFHQAKSLLESFHNPSEEVISYHHLTGVNRCPQIKQIILDIVIKQVIYDALITLCSQFQVQAMIKVAKVNFVVMKILMGGHKKDSQVSCLVWLYNWSKVF